MPETSSFSPRRKPAGPRLSGWLIGIVFGVLASLWAFPTVRYTLVAQMQFAFSEDSLPWLFSLDATRSAREQGNRNQPTPPAA